MRRQVFREEQPGRVPIRETGQNLESDSVIPAKPGVGMTNRGRTRLKRQSVAA